MFLKNRNISSKIKRSKVTEYAALSYFLASKHHVVIDLSMSVSVAFFVHIKLFFIMSTQYEAEVYVLLL